MNTATTNEPLRLIRISEVVRRAGLSRPSIYKKIAAGYFPSPIKIGSASAWVEHEVEGWIQARITEARRVVVTA